VVGCGVGRLWCEGGEGGWEGGWEGGGVDG